MAVFRLDGSSRTTTVPVEVSDNTLQGTIVPILTIMRRLGADQEITEMNGKPFNECTLEDVIPNGVNILTTVQRRCTQSVSVLYA